eukprot:scaffold11144_cov111-Isochrysis_galbana.AAC.11
MKAVPALQGVPSRALAVRNQGQCVCRARGHSAVAPKTLRWAADEWARRGEEVLLRVGVHCSHRGLDPSRAVIVVVQAEPAFGKLTRVPLRGLENELGRFSFALSTVRKGEADGDVASLRVVVDGHHSHLDPAHAMQISVERTCAFAHATWLPIAHKICRRSRRMPFGSGSSGRPSRGDASSARNCGCSAPYVPALSAAAALSMAAAAAAAAAAIWPPRVPPAVAPGHISREC